MAPRDVVVDASALAKLFLHEPESAALRSWYTTQVASGARFAGPSLLGYEIAQTFARNLGPLDPKTFARHVQVALTGFDLHAVHDQVGPFLGKLTVYDASYVATAKRLSARLVTYDQAMAKVARDHGVVVETPI